MASRTCSVLANLAAEGGEVAAELVVASSCDLAVYLMGRQIGDAAVQADACRAIGGFVASCPGD